MNLFYEEYPDKIFVNNEEIPIITDFREYVKLMDMLNDSELLSHEKAQLLLQYFKEFPNNFNAAIDALIGFVLMDELQTAGSMNNQEEMPQKEVYSFEIDYPFIFSAFLSEYGINIRTIPYMHWWEFRLLFDGLPEKTEIKQRIMYRSINLSEIKDKDERKRIQKIQNAIRLPNTKVSDYDIGNAFEW